MFEIRCSRWEYKLSQRYKKSKLNFKKNKNNRGLVAKKGGHELATPMARQARMNTDVFLF
jgi:hypothetical protein